MATPSLYTTLAAHAHSRITSALIATHGSRRDAATLLSITERTLHTLLREGLATGTSSGRVLIFEEGELAAMAVKLGWPDPCAKARSAKRNSRPSSVATYSHAPAAPGSPR